MWIAGLVLAAGQLLAADTLADLGLADDARAVPLLENAIDRRVDELSRFPAALPPPDVEDELVAALLALERLDAESALARARVLMRVPASDRLSVLGHRVAARRGDSAAVRAALDDYFVAPSTWRVVLGDAAAATGDVRLRDYVGFAEPPPRPSTKRFRTTLQLRLGDTIEPPRPSSPIAAEEIEPDPIDNDVLAIQTRVLALAPPERYRALRLLASEDRVALVGIPMNAETIDRLYPYFARSRHRALRERVRRSSSARGEALASLLLSPSADDAEKRAHAAAMRDAWLDAVAAAGDGVVLPIVGESVVASSASELLWEGPEALENYVRELVAAGGREPDALAAMCRFHRRYPHRFLSWLQDDALQGRAYLVMALSGDVRRLPLLIELAVTGEGVGREAAFRGLAEMDLGSFDKRLHRLAGDSDSRVRLGAALALAPSGEEWALRLLVAEIDETSSSERLRARRVLERLPPSEALTLVEPLVADGTATPFALEVYLRIAAENGRVVSLDRVWEILAPRVALEDPIALLAAARLEHAEARGAVRRYLGRR